MRNLFLTLIMVLPLTIFNSCVEAENSNPLGEINDYKHFEEYYEANINYFENINREQIIDYPLNAQKFIYKKLSMEAKREIWISRLDSILASYNLNHDQITYLNNLKSKLRKNYLLELKNTEYLNNEVKQVYKIFRHEEIILFFTYLNDSKSLNKSIQIQPLQADDCVNRCSWCMGDGGCADGINCNETDSGCGWFWSQGCDGECLTI